MKKKKQKNPKPPYLKEVQGELLFDDFKNKLEAKIKAPELLKEINFLLPRKLDKLATPDPKNENIFWMNYHLEKVIEILNKIR